MNIQSKPLNKLTNHAFCIAAGLRDGLRTAQFYARDLKGAAATSGKLGYRPTLLSKAVAQVAGGFDSGVSRAADLSVQLVQPTWRRMPSPFDSALVGRVIGSSVPNEISLSAEFTNYFFRAARHILERWTVPPTLVLEHRIEAVRRNLEKDFETSNKPLATVLAEVLVRLVKARPIARIGKPFARYGFVSSFDPNVAVMAAACVALLLGPEGRPLADVDEDDLLDIAGILVSGKLSEMAQAIAADDQPTLSAIFESTKNRY